MVRNGEVLYGKLWRVVAVKARYVESRLVALRQGLSGRGKAVMVGLGALRHGSVRFVMAVKVWCVVFCRGESGYGKVRLWQLG